MTKLLVEFSKDWADEFNCDGFRIFDSREDWDKVVAELPELSFYFGTNEGWEEGEIEEDDFTVTEISDEEADLLEKLLGNEYGIFPS